MTAVMYLTGLNYPDEYEQLLSVADKVWSHDNEDALSREEKTIPVLKKGLHLYGSL